MYVLFLLYFYLVFIGNLHLFFWIHNKIMYSSDISLFFHSFICLLLLIDNCMLIIKKTFNINISHYFKKAQQILNYLMDNITSLIHELNGNDSGNCHEYSSNISTNTTAIESNVYHHCIIAYYYLRLINWNQNGWCFVLESLDES